MLKRNLAHLDPSRITVVEVSKEPYIEPPSKMEQHPVGQRYRWLFGPTVDWFDEGFDSWVKNRWINEAAAVLAV